MRFTHKQVTIEEVLKGATKEPKVFLNVSNSQPHLTDQDRIENAGFRLKWYRERLPFATDPEEIRRLTRWISHYEAGGL